MAAKRHFYNFNKCKTVNALCFRELCEEECAWPRQILSTLRTEAPLDYCLCAQGYSDLKERLLEERLSEWGVTVESFVELCEQALKRDNDPRADRILGNILEYSDFQQFAEMMEKRNVDLQVCVSCCVRRLATFRACSRCVCVHTVPRSQLLVL